MEPPSPYSVAILNQSGRRSPIQALRRAAEATLAHHDMPVGSVTVLLTTSEHQQELNRTYRGYDEDTDVLTFPSTPIPGHHGPTLLGDISISIPFAMRQAETRGLSLTTELVHLTIHGVLHLAGYDDETEPDRRAMQAAMAEMAQRLDIPIDPEWESVLFAVVEVAP